MEKFLLEVIRFFVAIDSSNAMFFNMVHLIISIIPLLAIGAIISVSLTGERDLHTRLWMIVAGMILGLTTFRIYQVWWVFRGGIGDEFSTWTESLSVEQLFFLEKALPYILMGLSSSIVPAIAEKEMKKMYMDAMSTSAGTFIWLLATRKIQNLENYLQISCALLITLSSAALIVWIRNRIFQSTA